MTLPFDVPAFLAVFTRYNQAVWPGQFYLYALGCTLAVIAGRRKTAYTRVVAVGLGVLWTWAGGVYHLGFFQAINPAAKLFGVLFILQGILFFAAALRSGPLPEQRSLAQSWAGAAILGYALFAYPLLNGALGHRYPAMPTFGVPCPTAIATFGLLVRCPLRRCWWLWPIPLLWAGIGMTAAAVLGMPEDLGLPAAAILALVAAWSAPPARPAKAPGLLRGS